MALKVQKSVNVINRHLKIVFYGDSGTGKTIAGLTFPRVFVVDTENRIQAYAGEVIRKQYNIEPFDFVSAQTIPELKEAVDYFKGHSGDYDTLMIDSISSFFYDSYAKWAKILKPGDNIYTKVNAEMRTDIMPIFTSVKAHVVLTARLADKYKSTGGSYFQSIGEKADSDKSIKYWSDYTVKLSDTHSSVFEKHTGYTIPTPKGGFKTCGYSMFEDAIKIYQSGVDDQANIKTPDQIIQENIAYDSKKDNKDSFRIRSEVQQFCEYWMARSQGTAQDLIEYLNSQLGTTAKGFSEFKIKISEANTILEKAFPEVSENN